MNIGMDRNGEVVSYSFRRAGDVVYCLNTTAASDHRQTIGLPPKTARQSQQSQV
jgi:hypothetical protein